jgi:hypothetical protein
MRFSCDVGSLTVETQDGADPMAWQARSDRFSFAYQPSVLKEPIPLRP